MKQPKQIQSRPKQRGALEAKSASFRENRQLTQKEVAGRGEDEFSSDGRLLMLSPDPSYSKADLRRAIKWLNVGLNNGDAREFYVRQRWHKFEGYFRAWREKMRLEMRDSSDRHTGREAETLLMMANAWAAGDLPAVRRCMTCTDFFLAERSTQQFCKSECRSAFYHELETYDPQYKERKAKEAAGRRKRAKERKLQQNLQEIMSRRANLRESQLEAQLAATAKKFKVTLAAVRQIAMSLSPTKDGALLSEHS